jgi:signal transduction histidine kinase
VNNWIAENWSLVIIVLEAASGFFLLTTIVLLVFWLRARRGRRNQKSDYVDAELDVIDLELSLAEQTNRLRIIRELHEVAVHDVSVIISQADGARYSGASDPTAAVRAAAVIADTARNTLADLRRVMTVVSAGEAEVSTQPGLKSARDLFKVMREAGLTITFEEAGAHYPLKDGAELSIYRILQESLSNALKYGGDGTRVTVSFTWTDDGFQMKIDDDGVRNEARRAGLDPNEVSKQRTHDLEEDLQALTGVVSGAGVTEMRERTELFGGVFTATPVPGVGFSVAASFPNLRYHNGVHGVNLG